jgi:hypothetical protein
MGDIIAHGTWNKPEATNQLTTAKRSFMDSLLYSLNYRTEPVSQTLR